MPQHTPPCTSASCAICALLDSQKVNLIVRFLRIVLMLLEKTLDTAAAEQAEAYRPLNPLHTAGTLADLQTS